MFIIRGRVYACFTSSERVRTGHVLPSGDVEVYDLLPPGGKRLMARTVFESKFSLVSDVRLHKEESFAQKKTTSKSVIRKQMEGNKYLPSSYDENPRSQRS